MGYVPWKRHCVLKLLLFRVYRVYYQRGLMLISFSDSSLEKKLYLLYVRVLHELFPPFPDLNITYYLHSTRQDRQILLST